MSTNKLILIDYRKHHNIGMVSHAFGFVAFILLLCCPLLTITTSALNNRSDLFTLCSFMLVGIWSAIALFYATREYTFSIDSAHWTFVIFFFFYAPLICYLLDSPPQQTYTGRFDEYYLGANITVLIWCGLYSATRFATTLKLRRRLQPITSALPPQHGIRAMAIVIISLASTLLTIGVLGIGPLLTRNSNYELSSNVSKSNLLIINNFVRCIPVPSLVILLLTSKYIKRLAVLRVIIGIFCVLVTQQPFSLARFYAGTIFIGMIALALRHKRISGMWLPVGLAVGFVILMPILNLTRHTEFDKVNVSTYRQQDVVSIFTAGDFDAYSQLINTLKYVQEGPGINYGSQFIGNILFFVPRQIWESKPDGSGGLVAAYFGLKFLNLSEPLPAEGLLNFGLFGLALYAMCFSYLAAKLDFVYWHGGTISVNTSTNRLLTIVYPFYIGFTVFIMRGDFLNGTAYSIGFTVASWLACVVSFDKPNKILSNKTGNI